MKKTGRKKEDYELLLDRYEVYLADSQNGHPLWEIVFRPLGDNGKIAMIAIDDLPTDQLANLLGRIVGIADQLYFEENTGRFVEEPITQNDYDRIMSQLVSDINRLTSELTSRYLLTSL